jgi:death-on-curing protein
MNYVSAKDVLVIHARIIDETGGSQGVRDVGLLESAVGAVSQTFDGEDLHEGVFLKGAVLLKKLTSNHAFVDGNKRTAFTAATRFLYINDYKLAAKNNELVAFMVRVVEESLETETIADWLEAHSQVMT